MRHSTMLAGLTGLAIFLTASAASAGGWQGENTYQLRRGFYQGLTLGPLWTRLDSRR